MSIGNIWPWRHNLPIIPLCPWRHYFPKTSLCPWRLPFYKHATPLGSIFTILMPDPGGVHVYWQYLALAAQYSQYTIMPLAALFPQNIIMPLAVTIL